MQLNGIVESIINWNTLPSEKSYGEKGFAISKTKLFGDIKIRQVNYSQNYSADHWCVKGHILHILHILEGELVLDYKDGTSHIISSGTTYVVGDNGTPHMAQSKPGALVLIID